MRQVKAIYCSKPASSRGNGWAFPAAIRELLVKECSGLSVVHFFGGRADFGVRLDIDESTKPDMIGDAWLPPFRRDQFDVVILDPPYGGEFGTMCHETVGALLAGAAWVAKKHVWWFHPLWLDTPARMRLIEGYLVCAKHSIARSLQKFQVPETARKRKPVPQFTRGPAMKYNRWLMQPESLPFTEGEATPVHLRKYLTANSFKDTNRG